MSGHSFNGGYTSYASVLGCLKCDASALWHHSNIRGDRSPRFRIKWDPSYHLFSMEVSLDDLPMMFWTSW